MIPIFYNLRLSLFFIVMIFAFKAFSQQAKEEQLRKSISKATNPEEKAKRLNQLALFHLSDNQEKAKATALELLDYAHEHHLGEAEAWAIGYLGVYYQHTGQSDEAKKSIQRCIELANDLNLQDLLGYALHQQAHAFFELGHFKEANQKYAEALAIAIVEKPFYYSNLRLDMAEFYLTRNELTASKENLLAFKEQKNEDSVLLAKGWIAEGQYQSSLNNLDSAINCFDTAKKLASYNAEAMGKSLDGLAKVSYTKGDFKNAQKNWNEALYYYKLSNRNYFIASTLQAIAEVFDERAYYDLATKYLIESISIASKSDYRYILAKCYFELAWVNYRTNNFLKAEKNATISLSIAEELESAIDIAACYNIKGLILLANKKYDSSFVFLNKGLEKRVALDYPFGISSSLFNLGELYLEKKEYPEALHYFQRGLYQDARIENQYGIAQSYNRMGKIFYLQDKLDSCYHYLTRSLEIATKNAALDLIRTNYADMSSCMLRMQKPNEALTYQQKFAALTDTIFSQQTAQSMASFETLYELDKKNQQIEILNKDNQLRQLANRQQRQYLYVSLASLVVLSIVLFFFYRLTKKLRTLNQTVQEQNEELQAQTEELNEANKSLSELYKEVASQNEELQTQSEELNEANNSLSELYREVASQNEEIKEKSEELASSNQMIQEMNQNLEKMVMERTAQLRTAYQELDTFFYRASHDLRRPLTTFMGLAEVARITLKDKIALELFEKVNETAVHLDAMMKKLQSISDVSGLQLAVKEVYITNLLEEAISGFESILWKRQMILSKEIKLETSFYSYPALISIIISNLIENAIDFSAPANAKIKLRVEGNSQSVTISVIDNGEGIKEEFIPTIFDMYFRGSERSKGNGLGLYIVKKAVDKLNGHIKVTTQWQNGSTFSVTIPNLNDDFKTIV